jgi:hypothetical protein
MSCITSSLKKPAIKKPANMPPIKKPKSARSIAMSAAAKKAAKAAAMKHVAAHTLPKKQPPAKKHLTPAQVRRVNIVKAACTPCTTCTWS